MRKQNINTLVESTPCNMQAICKKSMWIEQALELAMDVIEKMTHSLKRASKIWNIILNSIFDHEWKTRSKNMELRGVLT
jgi:uncharacterized membrane protein